jgi:hypothetical protein
MMRRRCNSPGAKGFRHYGERGIQVCSEWGEFAAFKRWALASGYHRDLSIDRIDNDGNYEPSNCRWATPTQQMRNTSRNHMVEVGGKVACIAAHAEAAGINYDSLWTRVSKGQAPEVAVRELVERKNQMARFVNILAASLALGACSTPAVRDRVVEVNVPVATHPVAAADVPVVPAPLPKRPASASAALDVALAGYCQMVAYALKADPLLRLSAGLPSQEVPKFPECER